MRRRVAAGALTPSPGWVALRTWQHLGVSRYPVRPLLGRVWELRDDLSAYDASYVALAEALDCPVLTADARLSHTSGPRCAITLVGW